MTAPERPVASPCVSICALDEQDICTGCQRTVDEITRWSRMDNAERRAVLALCHERAKSSGLLWMIGSSSAS
ncbi:DUF1289 domain-containing protein [Pseudomonas protegens]|jgi:predicted Fe-S protein YdhL (DUF1289 family)|uniref:Fe-S protein n=4 Tax=Pseudomonas TaxID=286 RepID=Q4KHR5_PSEF5|nr:MULTISPECIES: DUF1289 domain-containing protein [Pseudomonas]BCQ59604.1 DUF1289 domain-containing protein [Pseudomonas sp. Boi14]GED75836.1 DUF1289 domain-containing protein [Pseudomonas fluorescens]AAY90374.1 conserved hypothetical protein [Pseudomonas protegens Pf-5]AGL82899.1 hypothetical protein PFLCHA0_c11070 [Pseudomonas protegens CHA0]APC20320.1 DUF1289 domain-containing protein [Pseudomonas protegens]